jgi:hypothetical protein
MIAPARNHLNEPQTPAQPTAATARSRRGSLSGSASSTPRLSAPRSDAKPAGSAESSALLRRMALPGCAYSCTELAIKAVLVLQTRSWLRPRLTPITRPDWRRARRRDRDTDRLVLRVSARGDRGDLSRCRWPS